jgi:ornithine carbamoyltransferase
MNDLITIKEWTDIEILSLLDLADKIKSNPNQFSIVLRNKTLAMLFQKTSTRTRISFESGIYQLGGNAIYLDWRTTNLHLGKLKDEIKCMDKYVDLILARVHKQETVEIIRNASKIPVINGLSNLYHPCQILSDLMTIREKFGSFSDIEVVWVGDGNNVCHSLIIGCIKLDIPISVATPSKYRPHQDVINWVKKEGKAKSLRLYEDPREAVVNANIVYTDTFVSMGQESETEERLKIFKPYQINSELLSYINEKEYYVMHCLPAHRGVEITDEILDSKESIVFLQAENRLHLQKALMVKLLEPSKN